MTKHLTILSSIVLIVLLLVVSVAGAAPALDVAPVATTPEPSAPEMAAPDKLVAGQNAGAYYLDYFGTINWIDPTKVPVKGALLFYNWQYLESTLGNYNWTQLDNTIAQRTAKGLSTGVFVSTFDGRRDGDIRSTPDYVIETPGTMIVTPYYSDYYQRGYDGNIEYPTSNYWEYAGDAAYSTSRNHTTGGSSSIRLGGTDNAVGSATRDGMRIPAMPTGSEWPGGTKMEVQLSYYMETTDTNTDADHLYVELLNADDYVLATIADVTNTGGTANAWTTLSSLDVSAFMKRTVKVRVRTTSDVSDPTTFYVDDVALNVRLVLPKYWGTPFLNAYNTFIQALGAHLRGDSRVDFVAIGTGQHGENQPFTDENGTVYANVNQQLKDNGLTSPIWVSTINKITDYYVTAFTQGSALKKNLLLQYAPIFESASEIKSTTDYAVARGVGVSFNGLSPDWIQAYHNSLDGSYDPMVSGGGRYNYVPIAFESYIYMLCSPTFSYWGLFNALDKHADYMRIDWDAIADWNGNQTYRGPYFEWAKDYWGQTVSSPTLPSVWTVLREHRNPMPLCNTRSTPPYTYRADDGNTYIYNYSGAPTRGSSYPLLGNFSYWLVQDDSIPGGKTVPETNDKGADARYAVNPITHSAYPNQSVSVGLGNCPTSNSYSYTRYPANYPCYTTPYNPDLPVLEGQSASNYYDPYNYTGGGKEAWVIRRTDQATGNPYMWFDVDDQYMDGSEVYTVKISVKYLDMGTDTWSLRYDSTSGEKVAGTITKTGTKQVKTAVFDITDGKFANGLAGNLADFGIDSRSTLGANDGNEWIHMVDVAKLDEQDPPTLTPTPTMTPTATNTPTVTPTATPGTGVVRGVAFHDANGDMIRDAGEPGLAGATLALKQGITEIYTAVSGAGGTFEFPAVAPGTYQLVDKTPPAGYLHNAISLYFVITANQTLDQFVIGYALGPTATPTATPSTTPTATSEPWPQYLPLLLQPSS
ncbi:MAG: prealbumin-like fold domain-containing protein [Coriobacteriia bacterium]